MLKEPFFVHGFSRRLILVLVFRWPGTAMLEGLGGEEDDEDQDTIKEAFLETSPYLLALTMAVSLLHSVFEFLAFKNGM